MLVDYDVISCRIYCSNNCGHSYGGPHKKTNLNRHMRYECGVEPKFQCQVCQKRFSRLSNLKSHCVLVHKSFSLNN